MPSFLVNPSHGLEDSAAAQARLASLSGRRAATARGVSEAARGAPLPVLGTAPDLIGGERWLNTPGGRPSTLTALHGRVVLVDFWTYSYINCIRTLPYLEAWDARYRSAGLTIVGVHTPEFPFERSAANVATAVRDDGVRYPVVQDNDQAIWDAYGNEYWPADYLVDGHGRVRLVHFGEGDYAATERAIRALLAEDGTGRLGPMTRPRGEEVAAEATPESYLGAERAERFANGPITPGAHDYGAAGGRLALGELRYRGRWRIETYSAVALSGAKLDLCFEARRVFLVLGSPDRSRRLRVLLDGRPLPNAVAGADVRDGTATIGFQRLYRLVSLPAVESHTLTLEPDPGVAGYAFTFG